jgi:hypothetical protein
MIRVGRHSTPVDGVVANGHALVPFAIPSLQVRQDAPVSPWPQPAKPGGRERIQSAARAVAGHRGWLAAIPVVLVNAVAFGAQLGFWRVHVPAVAEAVMVALALESIAIYLAWQAHLAQLADDSALRLRLAAYGMALVIGALNYSHFMRPGWRPTVEAVTFGMMSAISPWLWSVHSRRVSRDTLKARGLIEPHAVRLGGTRWAWHPWRSATVMWHATWAGETDPARAIALADTDAVAGAPEAYRGDHGDDSDERRDDDSDSDEEPPDERHDSDSDTDERSDKDEAPDRERRRQKPPDAGDKVRAVLKSSRRLKADLLGPDVAKRRAAKTTVAEKAGVSERSVERVMRELASSGAG